MKGFTLLEILVAVFILAILMAAIYGVYTSNLDAIHWARQKNQVLQMARITLDRMTKDLESAFLAPDITDAEVRLGMIGTNQEIDGKPADRLDFTALTHLPVDDKSPRTDLCEVGYQLIADPQEKGFILYRRDDGSLDKDFTDGGSRYELARRVGSLNITFQDTKGAEFDDWNTTEGKPGPDLPSLIRIQLSLLDEEGGEEQFTIGVHPAMAARQTEAP